MINTDDAYEVARKIAVNTGILKDLHSDKTPEGISRHENIQELLNGIKEFTNTEEEETPKLIEYIENVSLLTNDDKRNDNDNDKVILMTIHSAKGLEFKSVFLAGLEEDLFPSKFTVSNISELEEERRLFYVAITRAEKNLCISYAKTRYRWGQLVDCMPSRFIRDINPDFIEQESPLLTMKNYKSKNRFNLKQESTQDRNTEKPYSTFKKQNDKTTKFNSKLKKINKTTSTNISTTEDNNTEGIKTGEIVEHERFGQGTVVNIEGDFPNTKATIEFNSAGTKQLLLKFAKLKIVKKSN